MQSLNNTYIPTKKMLKCVYEVTTLYLHKKEIIHNYNSCRICGSHSSGYEMVYLLKYNAV
jgi:hypothetical protein